MTNIKIVKADAQNPAPSREEAMEAVETLIRWAGEDPAREGLVETPERVIKAYGEFFAGYHMDPAEILSKTFEELSIYEDFVLVKNIDFVSHCEHHMVPIVGKAHVAYWPDKKVVGISKLARLVDAFAKRLTAQEKMTQEIASALDEHLQPKGSAVFIDAVHHCMAARGVAKAKSSTATSAFTGVFKDDNALQSRFMMQIKD